MEYNINDWKSNLKFFRNDIVCFIVDWEEKFAFEETITTKLLLRRRIFQIKRIKLNYSFPNFQIQSHTISKNLSPRFKYISRKILSINLNVKPPSQIASYRRGKRIKKLKKKKMSNSTIKISKNITKDRLPVQKKEKKKLMIIKNEAWQFSNIENSRAKENTCPSPMTKSFHSAIFDSKRASVIDPPTNCISLLFMIRVVNSTNKSMGERGEKKIPQSVGKVSRTRPLSAVEGS